MRRWTQVALAGTLVLGGCALPGERPSDAPVVKQAIAPGGVDDVVREYRTVRSAAVDALDAQPLSTVETGALLDIDTGMFEVAEQLDRDEFAFDGPFTIEESHLPRFSRYPLWFATVVVDDASERRQFQVFERATAADPWLLTVSAELTERTTLPAVRVARGAARRVGLDDGTAMAASPSDALASLAEALGAPDGDAAAAWAEDPFLAQMRQAVEANAALDGVTFEQAWTTEPRAYALRTEDGGALVLGTLLRRDTFTVDGGLRVTWPEGTPQRAFWPDGVVGTGSVRYAHQVVLYVPPDGAGDGPRTLGASGGVVDSSQGDEG